MLTFYYKNNSIKLNKDQSIKLELVLNVVDKERKYIKFGDLLYNYGIKMDNDDLLCALKEHEWYYLNNLYVQNIR
jgi:hypothetical protein|tara:strand:+ start:1562 stop:1786 length:225 start_codon:yes stop_codon:yes gene_type:complete